MIYKYVKQYIPEIIQIMVLAENSFKKVVIIMLKYHALNFYVPPNPYLEVLAPNVVVFANEIYGK